MKEFKMVLALILFVYNINGQTNWREITNNSFWGNTRDIVIDNNENIFVGTNDGNGVIVSLDKGNSWKTSNQGIVGLETYFLYLDYNGNIYFVNVQGSLYRSTNKGQVWQKLNQGVISNSPVSRIYVNTQGKIYLINGEGLIVSNDNGNTYSISFGINKLPTSSNYYYSLDKLFTDKNGNYLLFVLGKNFNGSSSYYLYRSTDSGNNWLSIKEGLSGNNVVMDNQGVFYVSLSLSGYITTTTIKKSIDNGLSWVDLNSQDIFDLRPANNGKIYGNKSGLPMVSTDQGTTWNSCSYTPGSIVSADNNGKYWMIKENFILYSSDFGNSWELKNNYLYRKPCTNLSFSSKNELFINDRQYFLKYTTNSNWKFLTNDIKKTVYDYCLDSKDNIYVIAGNVNSKELLKLDSEGFLIQKIYDYGNDLKIAGTSPLDLKVQADSIIYFHDNAKGYVSFNKGKSWNIFGWSFQQIVVDNKNILGINSASIYFSDDKGITWTDLNKNLPLYPFQETLKFIKRSEDGKIYLGGKNGIYLSTDWGKTWTLWNNNSNLSIILFKEINSEIFLLDMVLKKIYIYSTSGILKTEIQVPLDDIYGLFALSKDGYLYYANSEGLYKYTSTVTGIQSFNRPSIPSFSLMQNYPNPFNPTTKIKFELSERSISKLTVHDILGKDVATLVNQELNAGYHEVNFDGSNLTSGVYYFRLTTPKFTSVKKMLLMK